MSTTIAVHVPNLRPRGELSVKVELRRLLSRRTKELDEAKQLVLSAKDWDDLRREMEADGSIVWRLIDGGSRKAIAVVGPKDWIDVVCDEEHASLAGSIGGFTTPPAESQRLAARRTRLDALFGHEDPMIEERVRAVEAEDRAQVAVQAAEHLSRENVECDVRATVERMVGAIDGLELLADEGEYEDGYDPDRLQIWSRRRNFIVNLSTASLAEKWMSDREWCITMIRAAIRDALTIGGKSIDSFESLAVDRGREFVIQTKLREAAEHHACILSDAAGTLRTERDELLRENAILRRKLEHLERKR